MKYSPCGECEIIHLVNCEISHFVRCEMKFANIRVSEYFTFAEQIFHSVAISLAQRENFTEKRRLLSQSSFFLAEKERFELSRRLNPTYTLSRGASSANLSTSPYSRTEYSVMQNGGESGIRTHGSLTRVTGFQDRLLKPLGHLSV